MLNRLIKAYQYIFPIIYCYIFIIRTSYFSEYNILNRFSTVLILLLFGYSALIMLLSNYSIRSLLLLIAIGMLFLISSLFNSDWLFFFVISSCFCLIGNSEKIISRILLLLIPLSILVIIANHFGIIQQYVMYRDGVSRYSFGFSHPNVFGYIGLIISCLNFCNSKYRSIRSIVVIVVSILMISYVSDSRSAIYTLIFLLLIVLCFYYSNKWIKKWVSRILIIFPAVMFSISLYFTLNYNNTEPMYYYIDKLLSGRIRLANMFYNQYGLSLFGNSNIIFYSTKDATENYGISAMVLDNAYMLLLIKSGILMTLVMIGLYTLASFFMYKYKNTKMLIVLSTLSLYGLFESYIFNYQYNIFILLILGTVIYREMEQNSNESTCNFNL